MGLNGYIIEKYNNMGSAYTCNRIVEEGSKEGIHIDIVGLYDTLITDKAVINNGHRLKACDFVINRYKWGKTKGAISRLGHKSYNLNEQFDIYVNKYEQVRRLHSREFLMPEYCLGTAMTDYKIIAGLLGTPFVAKGLESSMGDEIILVESEKAYASLVIEYGKDKEWLFEEFISSSFGRDIRFYSIRGKVIACMQRKSKGDFRANVALGGSVEPYNITPGIIRIAKDIYDQTQLDFLGIDLLFGDDKPYFCEINVMPGLEGIEKASGINVAREIIMTIKGDFVNEQRRSGGFCL